MTWNDPIVEEIHQIRKQIMEEHDNDLHKLFDHLRKNQALSGRTVVSHPPRQVPEKSQESRLI